MKILRICPEPPYLKKFRAHHRRFLKGKSYNEQLEFYREQNVLLPGSWKSAMEIYNHEVFELVYGDSATMSKWAVENQLNHLLATPDMQPLVLREMVKKIDPDVIFVFAGAFYNINPNIRRELKKICSKHAKIVGYWGDELPSIWTYEHYFKGIDFIFTSSSVYEEKFKKVGIDCMTIGNCFDNCITYEPQEKTHDIIFSGTTGYGYLDHKIRYERLIELMRKTSLKIWASEPTVNTIPSIIKMIPREIGHFASDMVKLFPIRLISALERYSMHVKVKRLATRARWLQEAEMKSRDYFIKSADDYFKGKKKIAQLFPKRVKPLLINTSSYYNLVTSSKTVVNFHRDEDADIGNVRCFEVTGLGSLLLTDRGEELKEFFRPWEDFIPFTDTLDCIEKIKWIEENPEKAELIAQNGQKTTLSNHTVENRAEKINSVLNSLVNKKLIKTKKSVIHATYDLNNHPISYDISFFLQAAEIYRKLNNADDIVLSLVWPEDLENVPGVSKEADKAVDSSSRAFRVNHICGQLAEMMPSISFRNIKNDPLELNALSVSDDIEIINFPTEKCHHTEYYRLVMQNSEKIVGFPASVDANRYVRNWLNDISQGRLPVTITLRQYAFDEERNSNIQEWEKFAASLDETKYLPIIVPDTDCINDFLKSELGKYDYFLPTCFDTDLRFALYEQSHINLFINNGPSVAATLNKNINYLMFKIVTDSVPHCTVEFIEHSGFKFNESPVYAGENQKWVWDEDKFEIISTEFNLMSDKIMSKNQ